jgi:membrane protease subunit HflC
VVRSTNREAAADAISEEMDEGMDVELDVEADPVHTGLVHVERGRGDLMAEILVQSAERAEDLGIEILDVRFKHIHYNEDVQQEVFARMIAERQRIAQKYRSEGEGEAAKIQGEKERELRRLESDAYRRAELIRGRADASAAAIYAEAFDVDPEFYRFMRTMETYGDVMDANTTLILTTESDFFQYLKDAGQE